MPSSWPRPWSTSPHGPGGRWRRGRAGPSRPHRRASRSSRRRDTEEAGRSDGLATAQVRRQIEAALALTWGPGTPSVELVAVLADGRSESPGESRTRWLLRLLGFGPTTPQFPVRDGPDLARPHVVRQRILAAIARAEARGATTG